MAVAGVNMAGRWLPRAVLAAALVLAGVGGWLLYERYTRDYTVTRRPDGEAVARIVGARLDRMGDLRVSRLSGTVQGVSADQRVGGLLRSTRVMKAPFEVSYYVDLATLDPGDFLWDEQGRTLIVEVPDVRPGPVNVDEARATLDRTSGLFVTRAAMTDLQRAASASAVKEATDEAASPARMETARRNARVAVADLFAQPLRAAGLRAKVRVRFAGEAVRDGEQWDRSRSLAEILAERG
ncbi:MAG: DUF4230 domain-containing protein [Sphingomonas sp.]